MALLRNRREGLWFTSNSATHFTSVKDGTWAAQEMLTESISAKSAAAYSAATQPQDPNLRGRIVAMKLTGVTPTGLKRIQCLLFRSSAFDHATDPDLDYFVQMPINAITNNDWYQTFSGAWNVSATDLDIPYTDSDGTSKFHIGLYNQKALAAQQWTDGIVVRWCWIPDWGM